MNLNPKRILERIVFSRRSTWVLLYTFYGRRLDLDAALSKMIWRRVIDISAGKRSDYWSKMIRYYSGTNRNASVFMDSLEKRFNFSFTDQRFLDIGCGLGGCCVAANRRGATLVHGIEIEPFKVNFAKKNCHRFGGVEIFDKDVVGDPALSLYDRIVCDQVMEHVQDPKGLLEFIRDALAEGGSAYLALPNGYSISNVISDPHLAVPLITLIESSHAAHVTRMMVGHDTYAHMMGPRYLKFSEITDLIRRCGLDFELVSDLPARQEVIELRDNLVSAGDGLMKKLNGIDASVYRVLLEAYDEYFSSLISASLSEDDLIHFGLSNIEIILTKT